jgi:RecA-family ATPase
MRKNYSDEALVLPMKLENKKKQDFSLMSLEALFEKEIQPTKWIVNQFFIESGVSLIVGKPKAGKSSLSRQIALSIAKGEKVLSSETEKGTVLYFALEEIDEQVQKSFNLLGALGSEPIFVHIGPLENGMLNLRKAIEKYKPTFVIIDPLFRLLRLADINSYSEVTSAMEGLVSIARDSKAHLCLIHHTNKSSDSSSGILGSTAIFGAVDAVLLLRRTTDSSYLSTRTRYGSDLREVVLEFDESKRSFEIGKTKHEVDIEKAEILIIKYLACCTNSKTEAEIMKEVVGSTTAGKRHGLRSLLSSNKILRMGKGGKADPYSYKSL